MGIARENPVRVSRGNSGENNEGVVDIWEGGKVFDELLGTLLEFLNDDEVRESLPPFSLPHAELVC